MVRMWIRILFAIGAIAALSDCNRAGQRDYDGDDDGESRTVDENAGKHRC